jgi:hypothetical protein
MAGEGGLRGGKLWLGPILVVDDDADFRALVTSTLEARRPVLGRTTAPCPYALTEPATPHYDSARGDLSLRR